jgi:DNA processing protein
MEDAKSWLTLARAPALHAAHVRDLARQGESPLALLEASPTSRNALGLSPGTLRALARPDRAAIDADLRWLESAPDRRLVTWGDAAYPPLLAQIHDAPLVLFVEGDEGVLARPQLAVVGTRHPTPLGRETAASFAAHLAASGLVVTSGLALGIDAAAHLGALQGGGRTVAVMGRGLDAVYPRENADLARRIVDSGGTLVTDIPTGVGPLKPNFPRRNRILSGLTVGTLVVEAALNSGSLITARLALEQGREVFAIPGSIHNAVARGCHRLLRDGARLVETVADIWEELGRNIGEIDGFVPPAVRISAGTDPPALDKDYEILLDAVGFEPAAIDQIVARTGFETGTVASMLLILELDGRIQQQPGGRYGRRLPGR